MVCWRRLGEREPSCFPDGRERPQDRRENFQAQRRGSRRDGGLAVVDERRRTSPNPYRNRGPARPRSRDADRARLQGSRHHPKQMDRFRDRFTLAGAKDDSRDAEVMASALRTDLRCFRSLAVADPVVIELREWSRIADDLGAERSRLTNRMREQLWRYFPAMLDLESDLGAEWLLDLWETAPTPHKAIRIREATVAKVLKRNRVRRFDAAHVLDVLRKPPVQVAAGTTEAASAHITTLIARIRLVNQQLREAHRQLDALTARLIPSEETGLGQRK